MNSRLVDYSRYLDAIGQAIKSRKRLYWKYDLRKNYKGDGKIVFKNSKTIELNSDIPIAIESGALDEIDSVEVTSSRIVTVENLTSFNRVNANDTFFIYLAGYHNTAKQSFIRKVAGFNPDKKWFHFGDIDPDGFYILENLRRKTGIPFEPLYMSIDELKKYKNYCKSLEVNDLKKANSLIESGHYTKEMQYMLDNNIKLEQEVISWKQMV